MNDLPNNWRWADVRAEVSVKERYFEPLAAQRGLDGSTGEDRKGSGQRSLPPHPRHPAKNAPRTLTP